MSTNPIKTAMTVMTLSLIPANPALADGYVAPQHHHYHQWYQDIQKQLGISGCCDEENNDCGPVPDFQDLGVAGVRVLLPDDLNWYDADEARKYYVDTPDGRAHVCRQPAMNLFGLYMGEFYFYCVFLPNNFS